MMTYFAALWLAVTAGAQPAATALPVAHSPQFENRTLWPDADKAAYAKETWEPARLLVWAKPGEGGDPRLPENWLENGKPAAAPPDEDADIWLPAADTKYTVAANDPAGADRKGVHLKLRHVTIGKNAVLGTYEYRLSGNLWLQEGSGIAARKPMSILGSKHTFIRSDNRAGTRIAQYITVNKYKDASVEFLGDINSTDELRVNAGTAVVGPNSRLSAGRPSEQTIGPEGTLQLLSGAFFGKHTNLINNADDIVVHGRLLAGSPERPLTKDAVLGVSFKDVDPGQPRGGLRVQPGGRLRISSQDPQTARLVIRWHGNEGTRGDRRSGETTPLFGVDFLGDVQIDGIEFDNVSKGGIRLPDPAARTAWKHVFYGEKNEGRPDELYGRCEESKRRGKR